MRLPFVPLWSVFLSLLTVQAWGATPSFDATEPATQFNNTTNPSFNHTSGTLTNGYAKVCVSFQDSTPGTLNGGVTYNGASMTALFNAKQANAANTFASMWGLAVGNDTSGTKAVVAHFSESMNEVIMSAVTYNNVNQSASTGTVATATGNTGSVSVTVTSAAGELVVDCDAIAMSTTTTITVGGGQSERANSTATGNHAHTGSDEPGAASVVMDWSWPTNFWDSAAVGVPLKPTSPNTGSLLLLGVGQ